MMRKPLVLLVAATLACKPSSPPPGASSPSAATRKVGVSLLTKTQPFYKDLEEELRATAAKNDLELIVQSAELDTGTQTAQVENFVSQKLAAIIICPVDSQAIGGAIGRANQAKIPVFTADIKATQGEVVSHVASDNRNGGVRIAEHMAKALGGKGKVAIIDHAGVQSSEDRVAGFLSAIKGSPGIQIVSRQSAGGSRDSAATAMENILQAHADLNAVFAINDSMGLGVVSALTARGRKDVVVMAFDADPEGQRAIKAGLILADAIQFPKKIGKATIEAVVQHLEGKPVPKEIAIETAVVDKAALETKM